MPKAAATDIDQRDYEELSFDELIVRLVAQKLSTLTGPTGIKRGCSLRRPPYPKAIKTGTQPPSVVDVAERMMAIASIHHTLGLSERLVQSVGHNSSIP